TVNSGGLANLGIKAGSYVLVQDRGVASNGPGSPLMSNQQTVKVTSVSGDTATIAGTFAHQFTVAAGSSVQLIYTPIIGGSITHIAVDGSQNTGSGSIGVKLNYAASSTMAYVKISNFVGTGASGGLLVDTGYLNNIHDVTCTRCGNGGSAGGDSITIRRQTSATLQNINITNTASQAVFAFSLRQTHYSTV